MKFDFLKDWKTSLFGLVIIAHLVYQLFAKGEAFDISTIMTLLTGAGFIAASDAKAKKDE